MTPTELTNAAGLVVRRNLTPNVEATSVEWMAATGHLKLTYFVSREPSEDDKDWWELAAGEMAGEFPEIQTVDLQVRQDRPGLEESGSVNWVYRRAD